MSDPRCIPPLLYNSLDPTYLPDYNYNTFKAVVDSILPENSKCKQDLSIIDADIKLKHQNGTLYFDSWAASPGFSDVQNLSANQKRQFLNSKGLSGWEDGNKVSFGARQTCLSAYMGPDMENGLETSFCRVNYYGTPTQTFCAPTSCVEELMALQYDGSSGENKTLSWFPENWSFSDPNKLLNCQLTSSVDCEGYRGPNSIDIYSEFTILGSIFWGVMILLVASWTIFYSCKGRSSSFSSSSSSKNSNDLFSLQKSFHDISQHTPKTKRNGYKSLDGIRVLSMFMIFICHICDIELMSEVSKSLGYIDRVSKNGLVYWYEHLMNIAVDSFLAIGGFLAGTILVKKFLRMKAKGVEGVEKNEKLPLTFLTKESFKLLYYRWLRFVPCLLAIITFCWLLPAIADGTKFDAFSFYINARGFCDSWTNIDFSWYGTILCMSSWTKGINSCVGWMWYIENDVWYYFVGIILAALNASNRKFLEITSRIILVVLMFFSPVYKTIIANICRLPPNQLFNYNAAIYIKNLYEVYNV